MEDTELEGNQSVPSLKVMVKLVNSMASMAEANGWRMDPSRLRDAAKCMEEGTVAGSGTSVPAKVMDLHRRLVEMKAGNCLMLPSVSRSCLLPPPSFPKAATSPWAHKPPPELDRLDPVPALCICATCGPQGWIGVSGGHAIMCQWHKRDDGDFDFVVINSGQGLDHHPQREDARGTVFKSVMRFPKIPAERATDTAILWVNRMLYDSPSKGHTPEMWYAGFLGSMLQTDQVTALAPTFCVEDDALDGDWMTPQRAGVCYFRCVLISFKYFLRSRGASREEVKRTTVYLRVMFMLAAKHSLETLGNCPSDLGPAAVSQSDLMLLRVGLHQVAHHTLKAVRRGHLTSSEAGWIEHTLSHFEEHLLPSCVIAGWADTGPPPLRFITDADRAAASCPPPGKVQWSPLYTGCAAKLLTFDPKFDYFCGKERDIKADANFVLANVMAGHEFVSASEGTCRTLRNALELSNRLSGGGGGVTPAAGKQLAMELLFDVLCCQLPAGLFLKRAALGLPAAAGDGSAAACWSGVPVGTAAFAGGPMSKSDAISLAADAHEAMKMVVGLWRATPNLDGQGVAQRNLAVIAAAQLLDASLRYAAPSDSGFLSSRLRGSISHKLLAQVGGAISGSDAKAGPGQPARLAFATAAGATLEEATAAFEASRPDLGEARRRVCEYDAIVTRDCALAVLGLDADPSASGESASAAAAASAVGARSAVAQHAAAHFPSTEVASAERTVDIALFCDFRKPTSKSIVVEADAMLLVEAELAARSEEYPVVSDASLRQARELMKSAGLAREAVPPLLYRSQLLKELASAQFGLGLSTNILLQLCLEPADHINVCRPCDEFASLPGTATGLDFDKDIKKCEVMLSVGSLEVTSDAVQLFRSVPLSPCDARLHGVASRAGRRELADEDDIMLAVRLDSFGDVLTPDESERLLALLTTETLRVPLALDFFGDSLVGALLNADLRQLLWSAVFELRDLAVKPVSHGEPLPVVVAPASSTKLLATPRGPLWYELRHCPASTLGALTRLIQAASKLCGAGTGNTFFVTLLFIARLAARVLQTATAVMQDATPLTGGAGSSRFSAPRPHHADLAAERQKVLLAVATDLEPALDAHMVRAQAKFVTENVLAIRVHAALLRLPLLPGELSGKAVADVLGGVALARVLHSFGTQAVKPFTMTKWRAKAPKPLVEGRSVGGRSTIPPGLEPPWMRAAGGVRMTEHNIAEITYSFRSRLVAWMAAASPSERSEALTLALRIVQRNDSASWDAGESLPSGSRPMDDAASGLYQGAAGNLIFVAQTFELRSTSGSSVQPVPETTAHHRVFKSFFGRGEVPYCTVVARRSACTRLSILGSPSLAAYGSLEVDHWCSPTTKLDDSSVDKKSRELQVIEPSAGREERHRSLLAMSGFPFSAKKDQEWLGVKHNNPVFSCGQWQGSFRTDVPWAAAVLKDCVLGEFEEAAKIPNCNASKLQPHKDAIVSRAKLATHALKTMTIYAPAGVELLADATSISLYCAQPKQVTDREIVLHRSTCAAGAGTGGAGWAEVFVLDEFARRVFRRPVYCSDVRRSMFGGTAAMQPLPYALATAPPAQRMFRGGDITCLSGFGSSVAVYRSRAEPSAATVATSAARLEADPDAPAERVARALFVPAAMLRGVLPGALLDMPLMWWLQSEADGGATLLGEPVPAQASADTRNDEGEAETDETATELGAAKSCLVMVIARVQGTEVVASGSGAAAAAAAAGAGHRVRWPGLQITMHHLYRGMRTAGAVGAAARAVFGRDHAALSEPPHSPGPGRLLHDMAALATGTALARLRDSLVRAESASHALAWSHLAAEECDIAESSTAPAVRSGHARSLWGVELPRLETTLEARPSKASPGGVRFFVSDRDGLFLNEDEELVAGWDADAAEHPVRPAQQVEEETTVGVKPLGLLAGLPHALVLRGGDGSAHLLVPSHQLHQQFVADAPFSTFVSQARGTPKWTWACARKTFLLSVAVSEGFLRVPSLGAALYLVQCLVAHRHYSRASRVLRSVDTDKPLSGTEQFLLSEVGRFERDKTPDMAAIRCQLCLCLRYVRSIKFPWELRGEVTKVLGLRDHVRSMCQLTHEQAASLLEMAEGEPSHIAMHRGFTKGATTQLQAQARISVNSRLSGILPNLEADAEASFDLMMKAEPMTASRTHLMSSNKSYWNALAFEREPLTSLDSDGGKKWLAVLLTNYPQNLLKTLVRLAVGDTTFDMGDGLNAGRRFARVAARCILTNHRFAGGFGNGADGASFPFVMAMLASRVNANGKLATPAGEHSGFPSFWSEELTTKNCHCADYVRETSDKVLTALRACGGQAAFITRRRAAGLPDLMRPVVVTPDMAPPQPPPVSGTTPLEPLILCGTVARGEAEKEASASRIVRAAQLASRGELDPAGVALAAAALSKEDVAAFGGRPLFPLLCQVSAERGHGMVVAMSADERGVSLPASGLPFEAAPAGGEPMPDSFVASSMRGRLEASCNDWHTRVKSGTEEQLRCFVLPAAGGRWRLPTLAEMADPAWLDGAIDDLETLTEHLQALFNAEVGAVRVGVPAVLAIANGLSAGGAAEAALRLASAAIGKPAADGAAAAGLAAVPSALADERSADGCVLTSLERLAGHRAPVSDDMLLAASLSASREADLTNANPMLAPNRARSAVEAAGAMMLRANRASQCSFCLGQSFRILGQLKKIQASGKPPGEIDHGAVIRAGAALAGSLVARRHYASTAGGTLAAAESAFQSSMSFAMPGEADEARLDPRFLVFEFLNGWLLRREQVDIVTQFVREMGIDVLGLPEDVDTATTPNVDSEHEEEDMDLEIGEEGLDIDLDMDDMAGAGIAIGDAKEALMGGKGVRGRVVSRITQARMGMGKTACVSPLCCLFMANGQSIVAQVVPAALLAQTQTLLSEIFAQVIPKRVVTLDFDRTRADDPVALRQLYAKIAATRRDRGVLITTASALKSMALLFVEELGKSMGSDGVRTLSRPQAERQRHFDAAGVMAETLDLFGERGQGRLLLDEVDMLFSPLTSELNFPISDTILIGPRPERWSLPVAMVAAVHAATAAVTRVGSAVAKPAGASAAAATEAAAAEAAAGSSVVVDEEEDAGPIAGLVEAIRAGMSQHALQVSPHLVLLEQDYYQHTLVKLLADWAAWWLSGPAQVAGDGETQPEPEELAAAVASKASRSPAVLAVCRGLPERGRRLVALARQWVTELLPHALTKINRVTFGLLTGGHASSLAPGTSRTRLLTSVPFVGLDVPSPVSEHAHPDVLIGLTALAYAYEGLQLRHLQEAGRSLRQTMAHQVGAISQRPARQLWSRWCRASMTAWRAKYGAVAEAVKAQRLAEKIPSPSSTGALDDAMFREAALGEPEVPDLELLQMDDAEQARDVFRLLGRHAPTARWFLNTTVFPFVCNHREAKLSASGQELGTDLLFAGRCGFSGTPNDLIPLELGPCDFEPGSEGQFLSTLTDPSVVGIDTTVANGMLFKDASGAQVWSVRALLKALATADPPYHALIDCGALITGMSNEDTAWMLLREGLPQHSGVVFLNEANAKMVAIRGRSEAVPLSECGLPFDKRLTIYDQCHTTGMDIKQAPAARALLTIGKDNTLRDVFQAAWRMRGIGKGQTISFLVTPEVASLVERNRGARAFATEDLLQGLFGWLLRNSIRIESLMFSQLCNQDMAHTWRRSAFRDMQAIMGGVDPSCAATPGLPLATEIEQAVLDIKVREAILPALKVFRQSVSFDVLDPMADPSLTGNGGGITASADLARSEHPRFVQSKDEERIGTIIRRSKSGAGEGDTTAQAGLVLGSEMVQEQEAEAEVEQEEDAERESELAQWFSTPDVVVPPTESWSIADLGRVTSSEGLSSVVTGSYPLSTWKPGRACPSPAGMPSSVLASAHWCPQDISGEPEFRIKLAAAVLTIGAAGGTGPAGVLLSLAEAEALRRAFHTNVLAAAVRGGVPSPGLWLVGSSKLSLLDFPGTAGGAAGSVSAQLPETSAIAAAALFSNNEVWITKSVACTMLDALRGLTAEDRLLMFESVMLRRRERRRAWQATPMRDVFTLPDSEAARRRDVQEAELASKLKASSASIHQLFAAADSHRSGRLGPSEVVSLAASVGLTLTRKDATALCGSIAALTGRVDSTVTLSALVQLSSA